MDVQTVVANALTFNTNTFVRPALQGLADADLLKRPSDQCNSIGWLLWHQTRVEDVILSHISGRPQTWVADTWHAQFGMPADPHDVGGGHSLEQVMALQPTMAALQGYAAADDVGGGHSLEQVMALQPTMAALQGYAAAVRDKTLAALQTLTPDDLERELPFPLGGTRTVGDFLGIFMIDQFYHSGQIAYVRGYVTGKGWFAR